MAYVRVCELRGSGVGLILRRDGPENVVIRILEDAPRIGSDPLLWPFKEAPKLRQMTGLGSEVTIPLSRVGSYVMVVRREDLRRGDVFYLSGQEDFYWYDDAVGMQNILESPDERVRRVVRIHYDKVKMVEEVARALRAAGSRVGPFKHKTNASLTIAHSSFCEIKRRLQRVTTIGWTQESQITRRGLIDELGLFSSKKRVWREYVETSTPLDLNGLFGKNWWWGMQNWSLGGPIAGVLARGMVAAGQHARLRLVYTPTVWGGQFGELRLSFISLNFTNQVGVSATDRLILARRALEFLPADAQVVQEVAIGAGDDGVYADDNDDDAGPGDDAQAPPVIPLGGGHQRPVAGTVWELAPTVAQRGVGVPPLAAAVVVQSVVELPVPVLRARSPARLDPLVADEALALVGVHGRPICERDGPRWKVEGEVDGPRAEVVRRNDEGLGGVEVGARQ